MILEIPLVLGGIAKMCNICGNGDPLTVRECEAVGDEIVEPSFHVGQTVLLYGSHWVPRGSVRTEAPKPVTITSRGYSQPDSPVIRAIAAMGSIRADKRGQVHRLKFWVKDDRGVGTSYWADELLLWQEGDLAKLEAAKLIHPPKPRAYKRPSWWVRMWSLIEE